LSASDQLPSQVSGRVAVCPTTFTDFQMRQEPLHLLGIQQSLQIGDKVFQAFVAVHPSIWLRSPHPSGQNQMLVY
jgi:hypothetical protein